jgi:hypothetical protein
MHTTRYVTAVHPTGSQTHETLIRVTIDISSSGQRFSIGSSLLVNYSRPSNRRLSEKLVPNFGNRRRHVGSVTDPKGRIIDFLDRSRYFFFQVAPQLYSGGSVDPVPDPLLLWKSGTAGNRTRISGSVARNFDHQNTKADYFLLHNIYKLSSYLTGNTIHLRSVTRNSDH